jgi:hypothetical protein
LIYSGQEAGLWKRLAFFDKDLIEWKDDKLFTLFAKLNRLKKENSEIVKVTHNILANELGTTRVVVSRILKVLEDDTFKKAFQEAKDIAATEARAAELRGEDVSRFKLLDIYSRDADGNWVRTGELPDVRTLDYVKRGIDALIDKGYSGEGMSKAKASALRDLKKEYVNVIDDATKVNGTSAYADARRQYAGDIEVLNALRYGKEDFLSPKFTPAQAIEKVKSLLN